MRNVGNGRLFLTFVGYAGAVAVILAGTILDLRN